MRASLGFSERLRGYAAFGESVPEIGYQIGKGDRTRVELRLKVVIDDVDAFIAGPGRGGMLRGSLAFDELGGPFEIACGEVKILPVQANLGGDACTLPRRHSDPADKWLTVDGVKELQGGRGRNDRQAFALRTILRHGEPTSTGPRTRIGSRR